MSYRSDNRICKDCGKEKRLDQFKTVDVQTNYGICAQCAQNSSVRTRRMKRTSETADRAHAIMMEAVLKVERLFASYKLPLENTLLVGMFTGTSEIIKEAQLSAKYIQTSKIDEVIPVYGLDLLMKKHIFWPIIAYTFVICNHNQVHTAKVLKISRNTLRDHMIDIANYCPHLITLYNCRKNWPTLKDAKVGYLDMDPAPNVHMDVNYEIE